MLIDPFLLAVHPNIMYEVNFIAKSIPVDINLISQ